MKEVFGEGKDLVSGGEEKRRGKRRIISGEGKDLVDGGKDNQNMKVFGKRRKEQSKQESNWSAEGEKNGEGMK